MNNAWVDRLARGCSKCKDEARPHIAFYVEESILFKNHDLFVGARYTFDTAQHLEMFLDTLQGHIRTVPVVISMVCNTVVLIYVLQPSNTLQNFIYTLNAYDIEPTIYKPMGLLHILGLFGEVSDYLLHQPLNGAGYCDNISKYIVKKTITHCWTQGLVLDVALYKFIYLSVNRYTVILWRATELEFLHSLQIRFFPLWICPVRCDKLKFEYQMKMPSLKDICMQVIDPAVMEHAVLPLSLKREFYDAT